jgi:hypothetical protein
VVVRNYRRPRARSRIISPKSHMFNEIPEILSGSLMLNGSTTIRHFEKGVFLGKARSSNQRCATINSKQRRAVLRNALQ